MSAILALLIRQALAACGGFFAANNITGDSTASIVIGLIMLAVPTVWSWVAKCIHLEDNTNTGWIENSEVARVFIGSLVSQTITALSVYFATDANNPELLGLALANAAASKFGFHQRLAFIGASDALKILFVSLSSSLLVFGSSCSFYERHQATLDAIVIDAAHTAADAALSKITREGGKQPRNVQPLKSADDADSETILEGPEPTAPVCEEPRGEALPACLKIPPAIIVPRYGVQVAAALKATP